MSDRAFATPMPESDPHWPSLPTATGALARLAAQEASRAGFDPWTACEDFRRERDRAAAASRQASGGGRCAHVQAQPKPRAPLRADLPTRGSAQERTRPARAAGLTRAWRDRRCGLRRARLLRCGGQATRCGDRGGSLLSPDRTASRHSPGHACKALRDRHRREGGGNVVTSAAPEHPEPISGGRSLPCSASGSDGACEAVERVASEHPAGKTKLTRKPTGARVRLRVVDRLGPLRNPGLLPRVRAKQHPSPAVLVALRELVVPGSVRTNPGAGYEEGTSLCHRSGALRRASLGSAKPDRPKLGRPSPRRHPWPSNRARSRRSCNAR
jgi:hypothetical protein